MENKTAELNKIETSTEKSVSGFFIAQAEPLTLKAESRFSAPCAFLFLGV